MKKVLAELHELINNLEDHGLVAEASTLQEVFVRVAQEADTKDDLKNDVENILKSHSAPEVIAELAKQMAGGDDTKTMSFAYGKEPADAIIDNFVDQAKRNELYDPSLLKMMNDRLVFNGHSALTKEEFLAKVNSSDTNVSEFAYEGPEFTESERTLGTEKNPLYEGDYGPHRMHGGFRISPLRGKVPLPRQPEPAPYKEPKYVIMNEFIGQAIKGDMRPDDAYFMMNQRLESNGHTTISKPEFDTYVKNKSVINPNLSVWQDKVPPRGGIVKEGPYQWYVKDKRDVDPNYDPIEEFREEMKEMNKRYEGQWATPPGL